MMEKKREKYRILFLLYLLMLLCVQVWAEDACEHDFQPVQAPATCTESGYTGLQCTLCFQTKDYQTTPQLGHDWTQWTVTKESDCREEGIQISTCSRCALEKEERLPKLAHAYEIWIQKPTCGYDGYTLHTCAYCGHEERTERIERLGHDLSILVVEPTCTTAGYTKYQCTRCTYSRKEDLVEKTGHFYDSGTVIQEAFVDQPGKIRYSCLNCDHTKTENIPAWSNPFEDVEKSSYCSDAVTWAYHTGVTLGTDETHFSPDGVCTRAQVVSFLWRWAGYPEAEKGSVPFTDVLADSFYVDAVSWAVEKGITKGVDESHFAPNDPCTRAQVVTLIHRYLESPVQRGEMPFVDLVEGSYYIPSVLWAYKQKITSGVDATHFAPDAQCTRGQIVTFLYRADAL